MMYYNSTSFAVTSSIVIPVLVVLVDDTP